MKPNEQEKPGLGRLLVNLDIWGTGNKTPNYFNCMIIKAKNYYLFLSPHLRICLLIWEGRREGGRGEREREKHPLICAQTGDQTCKLLVCRMKFQLTELPGQGKNISLFIITLLLDVAIVFVISLLFFLWAVKFPVALSPGIQETGLKDPLQMGVYFHQDRNES